MNTQMSTPDTRPEDMAQSRFWTGAFQGSPSQLPFSFFYDGKKITGIPDAWNPVATTRWIDANIIETVYDAADGNTGLTIHVELLEYRDFPVVEWIVWFANAGDRPTPILSDIRAIDIDFAGKSPILYHCNGDFCNEDGYKPEDTPLPEGTALTFAPNGGRSCDGAFPYYRVQFEGCGLTLAVGWPGQWSATFTGVADGVSVQAGQEETHLRLMPGERICTPRMTLLSWTGDSTRATNIWRRWYLAHILPRPDGQPMQPHLAVVGTDTGEEFTGATAENQLIYQDKFTQIGFDYDVWWIDAGWYPCKDANGDRRWPLTGSWIPDPERFPNGLKAVSENAEKHGARLLLWFEPERVVHGSELFKDHPDWLLQLDDPENISTLLNLGNPECRQWLTDHVCTLIQDSGIGIYRQDFNFPPLEYWRKNDADDRRGINENLHTQGYLQYWDDLLARNPGLWIDSCASGGRRNDLETMRRSVPLHYTDFGYGDHPVKLAFHHTLYSWIPYFKEFTVSWDYHEPEDERRYDKTLDSFAFHCGMAGMLFVTIDIRRDDYDVALGRDMIAIWRKAAPMLINGDYYPITPFSRSPDKWVVWQFDRTDCGDGLLQGIRHTACPDESFTAYPKGLDPEADYLLENAETNEQVRLSGADLLRDGFTLSLPPRSGVVWFYKRKERS